MDEKSEGEQLKSVCHNIPNGLLTSLSYIFLVSRWLLCLQYHTHVERKKREETNGFSEPGFS